VMIRFQNLLSIPTCAPTTGCKESQRSGRAWVILLATSSESTELKTRGLEMRVDGVAAGNGSGRY
jgi:hypothetical protein